MAKAKDINIYKIFSETYNKSMFGFMDFGELKIIPKVKTVKAIKFSVGMKVNFGKTRGKQYVGIVTKVNNKRAEVQMDTGGFARVPYSLMREAI